VWRCPAGQDATPPLEELRQIVNKYAASGVPEDLVDAAKRAEIAQAEFQRNSIPDLAAVWSDALAAEGRNSPDEDIDAIRKSDAGRRESRREAVSAERQHHHGDAEAGTERGADRGKGIRRQREGHVGSHEAVALPDWAAKPLAELEVPSTFIPVSDTTLPNGIRLIVRTDTTSRR